EENTLREDLSILVQQIQNDEISAQIDKLAKDIKIIDTKRSQRQTKLDAYNLLSRELTLDENPTETSFQENKNNASIKAVETDKRRTKYIEEKASLETEIADINKDSENIVETIKTLRENGNNISGRVVSIRNEILVKTGATKKEIPFVGELIKVADEEAKWHPSIEKVLHSFALRLIVPEKYYKTVNNYVNDTDLKGKITYIRYKDSFSLSALNTYMPDENELINKLNFKIDSPYADFVEYNIQSRFNYFCAEDMNTFAKAEKAITINGLIKRGKGNHEKDDRPRINSRNNFVLGWDNKAKIESLRTEYNQLQEKSDKAVEKRKSLDSSIKELGILNKNYNKLLDSYPAFDDIDWKKYALEIQDIK
ncbi:MAG: hypothetical protein AB3N10_07595, partial [Allomuricauda sp.]